MSSLKSFSVLKCLRSLCRSRCLLPSVKTSHSNCAFSTCANRDNGTLFGNHNDATAKRLYCTESSEVEKEDGTEVEESAPENPGRPQVDIDTSIRYMKSKAYSITYGEAHVWQPYRRNHKGHIPPTKIRRSCYTNKGKPTCGNLCPICRDNHLVLDVKNTELLKQFISPYTGEILSNHVTNLCMKQQDNLITSMMQAWDNGSIEKALPFKKFDYKDYYPQLKSKSDSNL